MILKKLIYSITTIVVLMLVIVQSEEETNFAKELTEENFDNAIEKNNHFVMFFAPWCGHCKRLHPLWEQLAEIMNVSDDPKVVIAKVDCTQYQQLCAKNEVTGYPTLRFFKLGESESVKFKDTRDMPTITDFINQQLNDVEDTEKIDIEKDESVPVPGKLVELTEDNFAKHVSSGNHFVKFYAPWCSHCQRLAPVWEELSKSMEQENDISVSKIDCTQYRSICQDFEVKGYPTLLWIEDGKKIEKYSGSRDHAALKQYVKKMLGAESKSEPSDVKDKIEKDQEKPKVVQLNSDTFEKTVKDGVTFVKFYVPWCGHCQELSPTWDKLAETIHSANAKIVIAKVDCTVEENRSLCVEQQVEGYPTLFAYKDGEKQSEYDGRRSLSELQNYIYKYIGHDEL